MVREKKANRIREVVHAVRKEKMWRKSGHIQMGSKFKEGRTTETLQSTSQCHETQHVVSAAQLT